MNNAMNFCHISPTPHLSLTDGRPVHLVLAHLIEEDQKYIDYYLQQKEKYNCTIIMDNSAFEMYKQGKDMYDPSKLIDMGKKIKADYIVMSDYPGNDTMETIEASMKLGPIFRHEGFKTFYVPQGQTGDVDDLIYGFKHAVNSSYIDYVGISILAAPLAYNVEKGNKLQRFNSRLRLMYSLKEKGILDQLKAKGVKIHLLGMLDGPNEVMFMNPFKHYIDTWDSSAAIWLGLNGESFDNTPTGRRDGKFELEVDFNYATENIDNIEMAGNNMDYIDNLIKQYLS